MGLWLEIVTLLIPGFNDSPDELRRLTEFLARISPDIPWHVTAFHGDYKMQNDVARDTTAEDLLQAVEIGRQSGLRYIYAGNLPGMVGEYEDTHCPQCSESLIKRNGYLIKSYRVTPEGNCPNCAFTIPGRWSAHFEGQIASLPFRPRKSSLLFTIQKH
jgi:pyruvate formate lyase activating enzyme